MNVQLNERAKNMLHTNKRQQLYYRLMNWEGHLHTETRLNNFGGSNPPPYLGSGVTE